MSKRNLIILYIFLVFYIGTPYIAEADVPSPQETQVISLSQTNDILLQKPDTEPKFLQITPEEKPPLIEIKKEPLELKAEENIFGRTEFKKTFDTGIVKDVKLIGNHDLIYQGFIQSNGVSHNLIDDRTSLWGFQGHFRDGTIYNFTMVPFLNSPGYPDFQNRLFEYYLKKNVGKHHSITVGQQRTPNTFDGCRSSFGLPIGRRSQLGSTYNNIVAIGSKVTGDWDWVEYNAGVFDTGRFLQNTFDSAPEFDGLISFKPIKNTEKYGKLKVGGGYSGGKRETSYGVYSGHILYDYKKAHMDFEYAYANGYNGRTITANKSDSFYTTFIYKLTPKIEPFCRFDTFNANTALAGQRNTEYTFGMHYYLKGRKTRLTLSYIYANHETKPDSNKLFTMFEVLL